VHPKETRQDKTSKVFAGLEAAKYTDFLLLFIYFLKKISELHTFPVKIHTLCVLSQPLLYYYSLPLLKTAALL
jgi:hypothetical protein